MSRSNGFCSADRSVPNAVCESVRERVSGDAARGATARSLRLRAASLHRLYILKALVMASRTICIACSVNLLLGLTVTLVPPELDGAADVVVEGMRAARHHVNRQILAVQLRALFRAFADRSDGKIVAVADDDQIAGIGRAAVDGDILKPG